MSENHLPISIQLEGFRPIDEVFSEFKQIEDKREVKIRGTNLVEHSHMQKYLVGEVKMVIRLDLLIPKIEKYTQHFRNEKENLSLPMD
jgi:hypothetical protein